MKLVPLSDRVVLKQLEAEETTKSGIILTSSAQEILLSFQRLYQDENADSPCYRNQWSERYRVR